LARLALETPAIARGGDPFVIRGFSPVTTIGGGRVIDPLPPRKKAIWPENLGDRQAERRLDALIERRPFGAAARQLPILLGVTPERSDQLAGAAGYVQAEEYWVPTGLIDSVAQSAIVAVQNYHRGRPQEPGMALAELRQNLRTAPWLSGVALAQLEKSGKLVFQDGMVRVGGFVPRVEGGNAQVNKVVSHITQAGLTPPNTTELSQVMGAEDLSATLRLAAKEGRLEAVERDRYYAREPLERFVAALVDLGKAGPFTPAQLRDRLGISRKFLIPLLEWADAQGITVRVGEGRRLRNEARLPWRIPVT
jgi:selenocysteine-specific elongation factor